MRYTETIVLKDGRSCLLRHADERDGKEAFGLMVRTHGQTDNMLTYPDEYDRSAEEEGRRLGELALSPLGIEIVAVVDGNIVASGGIGPVGTREKLRHRAEFGVAVDSAFWGLGIGRALVRAAVACARSAGYAQIELNVVSSNGRAKELYESEGFVEYGRNPLGFRLRSGDYQELVLMRQTLD